MEINWIIINAVLICSITLIVLVIVKNQKDKKDLRKSINAQDRIHFHSEREEDIDYNK